MSYSDQMSPNPSLFGVPVPPETYEVDEYFCRFTPRIHRDAHLADIGCWQCQLDLLESQGDTHAKAVQSRSNKSYAVGCINPTVGNFTALCASEAIPDRLTLISYIVEYAYVHDDIIEYAPEMSESHLREANNQLMEGLTDTLDGDARLTTRNNVRRQLQAKMATELLEIDKKQGQEILRFWKEMSNVFVGIRDTDCKTLEEYLPSRAIDAGCPWTMSLLCFSMDFYLTEEEAKQTAALTRAAYDAWVLVNDYFSWEKEYQNYKSNSRSKSGQTGNIGPIVSAVFLFMKWHNVDLITAKKMLRTEIIAREEKFCNIKNSLLDQKERMTDRILEWIEMLSLVTAGNFAWTDGDEEGTHILPGLSDYEQIALEPYMYLNSLPSKGIRGAVIDGLDVWYQVPERAVKTIQEITELLHTSSLMVDDIQDNSLLRRGYPATHTVFGIGQKINSANLLFMRALKAATTLSSTAVSIFTDHLINGHIGQGMDLYWTYQTKIITMKEYFAMVDAKTGGFFILIAELMRSEATMNKDLDVIPLMKVVGRFFQVRDDYQNLQDADYIEQKGFADDLSEGKISLPLIYALETKTPHRLLSVLQQRKVSNSLSIELRKMALDDIIAAGGLQYTKGIIIGLQEKIGRLLAQSEDQAGVRNWILRLMNKRLELKV